MFFAPVPSPPTFLTIPHSGFDSSLELFVDHFLRSLTRAFKIFHCLIPCASHFHVAMPSNTRLYLFMQVKM